MNEKMKKPGREGDSTTPLHLFYQRQKHTGEKNNCIRKQNSFPPFFVIVLPEGS
jgi:hypothetical protein